MAIQYQVYLHRLYPCSAIKGALENLVSGEIFDFTSNIPVRIEVGKRKYLLSIQGLK